MTDAMIEDISPSPAEEIVEIGGVAFRVTRTEDGSVAAPVNDPGWLLRHIDEGPTSARRKLLDAARAQVWILDLWGSGMATGKCGQVVFRNASFTIEKLIEELEKS